MGRIFNTVLAFGLTIAGTTGCAFFDKKEAAHQKYQGQKVNLEREIELLRLERRKIMLQNSLDRLDSKPLPGEEETK